MVLELPVRDYVPMAEADGVPLPGKKALFVEQASDAVHLDYMLDVLLHLQSFNSHPELSVALDPLPQNGLPATAALQAAAKVVQEAEKLVLEVVAHLELLPTVDERFESLDGILKAVLELATEGS